MSLVRDFDIGTARSAGRLVGSMRRLSGLPRRLGPGIRRLYINHGLFRTTPDIAAVLALALDVC